jgi:hypothetical protein
LARAADPVAGATCTPDGIFMRTGGVESSGAGALMVCNGGVWKSFLSYDATANAALNYAVSVTGAGSPPQLTADQNNYSPSELAGAAVLRLTSSAAVNITGLAGGANGRVLTIFNIGSNNIVLKNQSTSSTTINRFAINADITLGADQSVTLIYDSTSQRWRSASIPFSGSGGCPFIQPVELYGPANAGNGHVLAQGGRLYVLSNGNTHGVYAATFDGTSWSATNYKQITNGAGADMNYIAGDGTTIFIVDSAPKLWAYTFNGTTWTASGSKALSGAVRWLFVQGGVVFIANDTAGLKAYTYSGGTFTAAGTLAPAAGGWIDGVTGDGTRLYVEDTGYANRVLTYSAGTFNEVANDASGGGDRVPVYDGTNVWICGSDQTCIPAHFTGTNFVDGSTIITGLEPTIALAQNGYIYAVIGNTIEAYKVNGFDSVTPIAYYPVPWPYLAGLASDGTYIYIAGNDDTTYVFRACQ